jgi:hypothetical protein
MYNIVEEELNDLNYKDREIRYDMKLNIPEYVKDESKTPFQQLDDKDKYDKKVRDMKYPREYMKKIQDIMDAKELNNPFDVYRQVKHIIEEGQNRSTFNDYSRRIKEHPKYNEPSENVAEAFKIIRLKKEFIRYRVELDRYMGQIIEANNSFMQPTSKQFFNKLKFSNNMRWAATSIRTRIHDFSVYLDESFETTDANIFANEKVRALPTKMSNITYIAGDLAEMLVKMRANGVPTLSIGETQSTPSVAPTSVSEVDVNNEVHRLKRAVIDLENTVAEL